MVEVVEVGRKGVGKMVGGGGEDDVTGETGGSCFTISSSVSKSVQGGEGELEGLGWQREAVYIDRW